MADATYTVPELTQISDATTTTNWSEPTSSETQGGGPTAETDYFIQGTGCISKGLGPSGTGLGGLLYNAGSGQTISGDNVFLIWFFLGAPNSIDTVANGGGAVCIGSSTANYRKWYVLGSDNYVYGGWKCIPVDPDFAGSLDIGTPSGTLQYFGFVIDLVSAVTKGNPFAIDIIRHGRGTLQVVDGVGGADGSFVGAAAADQATSARWGLMQLIDGTYVWQGHFLMGTAGTAVEFTDADRNIVVANTLKVNSGFNLFEIRNASSIVNWTRINVTALGTASRGTFTVTDNADVNLSECVFTDMGVFTFLSASGALNCTFRRCDTINAGGGILTGSTVAASRVAADESALIWDTSDPDGNLDDMTFVKGANAHHAISLSAAAATHTITLRGITVTGFNASDAQDDSVLELEDRGDGTTWNINLVGTSGTFSFKKRRGTDTVNIIANPVTLTVTVVDLITGNPIQNVNVLVEAAAGGPLGVGTDIIKALTDVNGQVSDTRTYASNQPITGRARKAPSGGPYYKTGSIAGTINSSSGLSLTVQMILDT